jgi:hypothetical protein
MPFLTLPLPPHEASKTIIETASKYRYIERALIYLIVAMGLTAFMEQRHIAASSCFKFNNIIAVDNQFGSIWYNHNIC